MRWWHRLGLLAVGLSSCGASCGQQSLAIMPGIFNDPEHRTLRRDFLGFAIDEICPQVLRQTIPLRLRGADPSTGRFFPTSCEVTELGNEKNLFVQLTGHGYAWNSVTGRLGFEAVAKVEYEHDFLLDGSTMYVYFRERHVQTSSFTPLLVERAADPPSQVTQLLGTDMATAAKQIGEQVLMGQLGRGFTVIREPDGASRVAIGMLPVGESPFEPFGMGESTWPVLANDRTELHTGQVDFAGPFVVEGGDALWLTALVEGAPAVDVLVYAKAAAMPWVAAYERQGNAAPAPVPAPVFTQAIQASPGRPVPFRAPLRLPAGEYVIVFDNSGVAGPTSPAVQPMDDRAALVSYAVQLGDPP